MAGVSALLKSAQSAAKKVQQQEDALQNYNWQSSAQTYSDFVNYSKYLNTRLQSSTDVTEQIGYATTLRSAQRSYTSNEIQRTTQDVMAGNATTQDKMDTVRNLFDQAVANGDSNLSQNLFSQWQSLSVQQQNEQQAATKQYAAAGSKAFSDLTKSLIKGVDDVTLPTGQKVTPLAALSDIFQNSGDTVGVLQSAQETLQALAHVIIDSYNNATDQDTVDKLEEKYGAGLSNLYSELKVNIGGKNLDAQDVTNAVANDQLNNPSYGLQAVHNDSTGKDEYKLTKNNVDNIDYVRQVDSQGNESYVPLQIKTDKNAIFFGNSDQGRGLDTQITNNGEIIGGNQSKAGQQPVGQIDAGQGTVGRDASQSIGNRLKELGIQATHNGTTLMIKLPGENVERTATIQPDGSIRFFTSDGQVAEIGVVDRNLGTDTQPQEFKAGQVRIVNPDEISDFGTASAFGGQLSSASAQGSRYVGDIMGRAPARSLSLTGPINTTNDFSGFGSPVTSSLLQSAATTQRTIQLQQQEAAMAQAQQQASANIQSSGVFNLNQVPVQQLTSQGILKKQLRVAAPTPLPRVVVAPPTKNPKITSVGVATPGKITGVSVAAPQPKLVVR